MTRRLSLIIASAALGAIALGGWLSTTNSAAAQQSAGIHIYNNESEDMFVTITDLNSRRKVWDQKRLNKGQRITEQFLQDKDYKSRISWTSEIDSKDPRKVKCGKGEESGLGVGAEVKITARGSC